MFKNKFSNYIFIISLLGVVLVLFLTSCQLEIDDSCKHKDMTETKIDPTCDKEGYVLRECPDCSFSYKSEFLAPTGHTIEVTEYAADCATEGYTHYECHCGYSYDSDFIPPLKHSFLMTVHEPTCTLNGGTDYRCQKCGFSYSADFKEPLGHKFTTTTTNPTCDTTGFTSYYCACGYEYVGDFIHYSDIFTGAYAGNDKVVARGLDVSKYNHSVNKDGTYAPLDWKKIKAAGFDFVILKIGSTPRISAVTGDQLGGLEPTFEADYKAAREAGLDVGVYFYTYATTVEATKADAELVLEWLNGRKLEYPVYYDLEDSSLMTLERKELTDLCVSFISEIQDNKYYGALYTNNNWLVSYLQSDKVTFLFDIWYARYGGVDEWNTEKYGEHMCMWQYTDSGIIPELSETQKFDFNLSYKDYPAIIKDMGYNGY